MLWPAHLSAVECHRYWEWLTREVPWRQEPIKIFGRSVLQPRLTAWYGEADHPYGYSGVRLTPAVWPATLLELRSRLEPLARVRFTGVLLNFYRDGDDSMGWHSDDEPELGPEPVVGSLSFGAARRFRLRLEKKIATEVTLGDGDFLLMRGASQRFWQHAVPKEPKVRSPRINLTFRAVAPKV